MEAFGPGDSKPAYLYSPPPDATNRINEFRQTYRDGITRTLDAQPVHTPGIKQVHWVEPNRLLDDTNPTNVLYAIDRLDSMSKACGPHDDWPRSDDFKRADVLNLLKPLLTNTNDSVAIAAINCFRAVFPCSTQLVPHVEALIENTHGGRSIPRRLAAIAALSDSRLEAVHEGLRLWRSYSLNLSALRIRCHRLR